MVPQDKSYPDPVQFAGQIEPGKCCALSHNERTETVPAQEKVAFPMLEPGLSQSGDNSVQLSAEEVYAQRLAEVWQCGGDHNQGFVP